MSLTHHPKFCQCLQHTLSHYGALHKFPPVSVYNTVLSLKPSQTHAEWLLLSMLLDQYSFDQMNYVPLSPIMVLSHMNDSMGKMDYRIIIKSFKNVLLSFHQGYSCIFWFKYLTVEIEESSQ
jgi:hypothetical protein